MPTAIDLFAGCGGLSQGLKDAKFRVIGAVEIDSKARETYSLNHPEVPLLGSDIRQLECQKILQDLGLAVGDLDLLAGCPPCQGFSSMRRKNKSRAVSDERNALIDDFCRLALGLMPKLIMMENVPAIAKYRKFSTMLSRLRKAGYSVDYKVLDVSDYGVPQRRKRLIVSANREGKAVLAAPNSEKITVHTAIGNLEEPGRTGDPMHDFPVNRSARIQALISSIPVDGGSRGSLPLSMQLSCHKNVTGFNDVYGRMSWNDVSPTITGGCVNPSKGRFLHPTQNRAITLREAAILQGFPRDYIFNPAHGKESISLMIGNALPPLFISKHAVAMLGSINL